MDENKIDYDYIVTPYPEKISQLMHLPYPVTWLLVSLVLFLLHAGRNFDISDIRKIPLPLVAIILFSLLPALIAIAIIWFSKALEKFMPAIFLFIDWPKEEIRIWYESELRAIFRFRWMFLTGIGMFVVILAAVWSSPFWAALNNLPSKITFGLIVLAVGLLGGGLLYNMIRIALMINKMGGIQEIKVSIYQHPVTSVKAVGTLLGKIAVTVIVIYAIGVAGVCIEPKFQCPEILLITVFLGIVVAAFFVFPQLKIYKIMSNVKHMRLRRFSAHLENCLERVTKDPSQEHLEHVRELFEIQRSLSEMGEWPFDTKLLVLILTSIAIPIIAAVLQAWYR